MVARLKWDSGRDTIGSRSASDDEELVSTTLAVMADMHLPAARDSAQYACLEWALSTLVREKPDITIALGDITAAGSPDAARYFRARLEETNLPFLITPGNSDRRTPNAYADVMRALKTPSTFTAGECILIVADSSDGTISSDDRQMIERLSNVVEDRNIAILTHHRPQSLGAESLDWLVDQLSNCPASLFVTGHGHRDRHYVIGGTDAYMVRGLDPDKAIGGRPALVFFDLNGTRWERRDLSFPLGACEKWSERDHEEFVELLGISSMGDPLWALDFAVESNVRCVELRSSAADEESIPRRILHQKIFAWRGCRGSHLSWHMPNLSWDDTLGTVDGVEVWQRSLDAALELGVQALTIHVPRVPVGLMEKGSNTRRRFSDVVAETLTPAAAIGVVIGIENLHMRAGEPADTSRGFGYLPSECLEWISEIRSRLGYDDVGLLLDVGHARNNAPFSAEFTLGQWYARVGGEAVGYHLHQVARFETGLKNHQPIHSPFGPLISFSSFLWAWKTCQLNHRPMFLEIPDVEGCAESLEAMRDCVGKPQGVP